MRAAVTMAAIFITLVVSACGGGSSPSGAAAWREEVGGICVSRNAEAKRFEGEFELLVNDLDFKAGEIEALSKDHRYVQRLAASVLGMSRSTERAAQELKGISVPGGERRNLSELAGDLSTVASVLKRDGTEIGTGKLSAWARREAAFNAALRVEWDAAVRQRLDQCRIFAATHSSNLAP
jgi:hypothetical protein